MKRLLTFGLLLGCMALPAAATDWCNADDVRIHVEDAGMIVHTGEIAETFTLTDAMDGTLVYASANGQEETVEGSEGENYITFRGRLFAPCVKSDNPLASSRK